MGHEERNGLSHLQPWRSNQGSILNLQVLAEAVAITHAHAKDGRLTQRRIKHALDEERELATSQRLTVVPTGKGRRRLPSLLWRAP